MTTWQQLRRNRVARGIAVLAPMVAVIAAGLAAVPDAGASPGGAGNDAAIVGVADRCVDVRWGKDADGTPVQLWTCNGTGAQRWTFEGQQGPVRALGKCLAVADGSAGEGAAVRLSACDDSDGQRWWVTNGRLINAGTGKCLDAHGGTGKGTPLQVRTCADRPAQAWIAPASVAGLAAPKKGVSTWNFPRVADSIRDVRAGWYHDWSASNADVPAQAEFVPTIWGPGSVTDTELESAKKSGTALLGFHEPDRADQANLTVEKALELWPRLEATGLRLGSPGVASGADTPGGWLDRFLTGARKKNLRVDFITVHWFGSDFGDAAAGHLMSYVEKVHQRYDLPVWVTQFGLTDFAGEPRLPTAEQLTAFLTAATRSLEAAPYVERYAYAALPAMQESEAYGLYRKDATPTAAGKVYRDAGGSRPGVPGPVPAAGDPQPQRPVQQRRQEVPPPKAEVPQPKVEEPQPRVVEPERPKAPEAGGDAGMENRMIELINVERAKAGCRPIARNEALTAAARGHSRLMAERNELTHQFPGEPNFGDRFTAAGYVWSAAAENATSGIFATPEIAMYGRHDAGYDLIGFMESPGHRANIVNCGLREVGVGVARDADGGPWWTQDFANPG
ncbi:glycosyl hydrolase [Jidongwangia harbinensis]|uniref:glycosyl hydrolase n=1 Tax=Jidongwangia harbinensis TaxID=2878561 RepID=UPI001CDA514C|nr:glycosyl hydrolase [Jidongwangia harbinensis]MCA2217985.1 ricin-type beta-trefoil lectin domain protein [Jidongwangia harbinensis]